MSLGKSVKRVDGVEKVTGAANYVDDLKFSNMLYAKVLRSPYAHARILRIDTSKAAKLTGVKAVVTGKDFPNPIGLYLVDRTFYAIDKVRYMGEPVAAVAATNVEIAKEAIKLIEVEYEQLPGVFDPVYGASKEAPLIHEKLGEYEVVPFIFPVAGTNISNYFKIRKGNVDKAFDESDYIVEGKYHIPHIQHAQIEPHVAVAKMDRSGKITLWSASQSPNAVRKMIATSLDIPLNKIRVITPYVGGGFGGKAGATIEGIAISLAMRCGNRPVKLLCTREEVFRDTFVRQAVVVSIKSGVTKEGKIIAQDMTLYWDGGAYTEYGVNITRSGGYCSAGCYEIPNMKTDSICVYTNHPVGGPFRGFGMPEIHWAIEAQIDNIASKIAMDPVKLRLKNAYRDGSISTTGEILKDIGVVQCIEKAAQNLEWDKKVANYNGQKKGKFRGKGIAAMVKGPSMPPNASSSAVLKFNEDGSVNILTTAMEIGQGSLTAMAQIASEVLGVEVEDFTVMTPDTDYTPYEWQTVASRITYSCGNAVLRAAQDAKEQILDMACRYFELDKSSFELRDKKVIVKNSPDKFIYLKDLAIGIALPKTGDFIGGPIIGRGSFMPQGLSGLDAETGQGPKPAAFWTFGCQGAEVEVDVETGQVKVLKVSAVYDIGKVLNPQLATAQVHGGIVQGIGAALWEEMKLINGKLHNPSFVDYKIPAFSDTPEMIVDFVETPLEDGPFGIRGFAEHTMVPTASAVANAVYDAVGIRINDLPISAEKLLKALREKYGY
jgi:CO/xanthine dehydrogenase Mo-binding subunit